MEVKLVVTNGRHTGREIPVKGSKFFIGRAEDCHLRPGSDLVSRHHCVIRITSDAVTVRDLGSRNGTFVNGNQVSPECQLMPGDRLVVGQLDFDVRIVGMPDSPKPATTVGAVVATSAGGHSAEKLPSNGKKKPASRDTAQLDEELDISQWFGDERGSAKTDTKTVDVSTIVEQAFGEGAAHDLPRDPEPNEDLNTPKRDVSEEEKERARRARGGPTTQDAAAEMLKKLMSARR